MSTHPTPAEIDTLMRTLVRILAGVAALALIFTAVNVPRWPYALTNQTFSRLFGTDTPVLMAVPTRPGTVRALLAARGETSRFHVVGYQEPSRPTTPEGLLEHCGLSAAALSARAALMIKEHCG